MRGEGRVKGRRQSKSKKKKVKRRSRAEASVEPERNRLQVVQYVGISWLFLIPDPLRARHQGSEAVLIIGCPVIGLAAFTEGPLTFSMVSLPEPHGPTEETKSLRSGIALSDLEI